MPGYEAGKHIDELFEHDILARTKGTETIDIMLATSARDAGNDTTTDLRAGLVLGKISDGSSDDGKYKEFDDTAGDGSQLSSDVLILMHDVHDVDQEATKATALRQGTVKERNLYNGASVDWSQCQRIVLSDQEQ